MLVAAAAAAAAALDAGRPRNNRLLRTNALLRNLRRRSLLVRNTPVVVGDSFM
jgi:hypothetical protein